MQRIESVTSNNGAELLKLGFHNSFGKRNVLKFDLNYSKESFCRRGRGRSFNAEGPKTEQAREPTMESLLRGIWRLRVSEAERRVREGV